MDAYQIMKDSAKEFGFSIEQIRSRYRGKKICDARFEIAKRIMAQRNISYAAIGRIMHRDGCTIRYMLNDGLRSKKMDRVMNYMREKRKSW